jgi:hypothetical protein
MFMVRWLLAPRCSGFHTEKGFPYPFEEASHCVSLFTQILDGPYVIVHGGVTVGSGIAGKLIAA